MLDPACEGPLVDTERLKSIIGRLEHTLAELKDLANLSAVVKPNQSKSTNAKLPNLSAFSVSSAQLGPIPDYTSAEWPEAIDEAMIIDKNSKAEQKYRALQIINHIKETVRNKKILDFGCGNGYVAAEAAFTARLVVGYDVRKDPMWDNHGYLPDIASSGRLTNQPYTLDLTTDINKLKEHAPFDLIILYDVLDHVVASTPLEVIKTVRSLLADDGCIFIRTHPWTSRTGGHIYEQYNKAYLHLALTPDEMVKVGIDVDANSKIVRPIAAYELWFKEAGLTVTDRKAKTNMVEPFFDGSLLDRIIKINWGNKIDRDTARKIMSNHLIDYKLKIGPNQIG